MLERVNGAGRRLTQLLDEFERAAWIAERPRGPMLAEPVGLAALVEAALARLGPQVARGGVRLAVEMPESLPDIEVDPELVGAAVEYMLDFAIARSHDGRVDVSATADAATLSLYVGDAGGRIDPEGLATSSSHLWKKTFCHAPRPAPVDASAWASASPSPGEFAAHGGVLTAEPRGDPAGIVLVGVLTRR